MPEPTSSQGSTPTPYKGTNGSSNGSDDHWNQVQPVTLDIVQNGTQQLQWRELPVPSTAPIPVTLNNVSNVQYVNSGINHTSSQIQYNHSSYMNMPYQRPPMVNGYTPLNPARAINGPIMTGPNIIRTPNGQLIGGSNWPSQPVLGRYVAQAPTWTGNKTSGGVKKQKRIRTAFTSQQMMELEQEYARTRYLDRARRIELADVLRLNERTIKIWFQNRRMKEKKDRAESLEDSEEASTPESSTDIGNVQMPMLIHEQYPTMSNEMYNQAGVYIEQYPSTSAASVMPVPSMYTSQVPVAEQNVYTLPEYINEEQCHQYQQVHLQVQHYPVPYVEKLEELSPETVPSTEAVPAATAPSDIIEKSWDLSWIKSIDIDENDC